MATIELPTGLVRKATAAGVPVQTVAEEAIRITLSLRHGNVEGDDVQRYDKGLQVGRRWAGTVATAQELASLAALAAARWRDFRIEPGNSLCGVLVEEGLAVPGALGDAWLTRGPFADGVIAAAVEATRG